MHDSFTPLGGMVPMVLMQLGEIVFGGVGAGFYGMLLYVVLAVPTGSSSWTNDGPRDGGFSFWAGVSPGFPGRW